MKARTTRVAIIETAPIVAANAPIVRSARVIGLLFVGLCFINLEGNVIILRCRRRWLNVWLRLGRRELGLEGQRHIFPARGTFLDPCVDKILLALNRAAARVVDFRILLLLEQGTG